MLRKIVAAVVLVPLAILIIALAVANRQVVTVSLDPFGTAAATASLTLPLFALLIAMLIVGVLVGGTAAWLRQSRWRRTARRLEREVRGLRAKIEALECLADDSSIVPRQPIPLPRLKLRPPSH